MSVAAAALAFAGVSLWVAVVVAVVPWALFMIKRMTVGASLAIAVLAGLFIILLVLFVGPFVLPNLVVRFVIVIALVGLAGSFVLARTDATGATRRVPGSLSALGAVAGPVLWLVAYAITQFMSLGDRFAWAMANDSPNYIIFARTVIAHSGFDLGSEANPVPLPSGLVVLGTLAGRPSTPSGSLLLHDVSGYSLTWTLLISLTCLMAGLLARGIVRGVSPVGRPATVAAILGSILPLGWFVTGYPIEYGFFNADVAFPLLLGLLLLWLDRGISLRAKLFWFEIATTLTLAIWSPLAAIPIGLGLAALIIDRARLREWTLRSWLLMAAGAAQFLVYAAIVALPPFLQQRSALAAGGGVYDIPPAEVFIVGAMAVAVAFVLYRRLTDRRMLGIATVVVFGWAAIAALLFFSRKAATPWTYYPLKLSWMMTVIFAVVIVGALMGIFASGMSRTFRIAGLAGAVALSVLLVGLVDSPAGTYQPTNPVSRLLGLQDANRYSATYAAVLRLADPDKPRLLWRSSLTRNEEGTANIWLTLLWSKSLLSTPLRLAGLNAFSNHSVGMLCTLGTLMGPGLEVQTTDSRLAGELAAACPGSTARVVLERTDAG
jgi:hypothetical protein